MAILSPFPSYSISVKPNNLLLSADQTSPLIFISSNINIPTLHSNGLSDCSNFNEMFCMFSKHQPEVCLSNLLYNCNRLWDGRLINPDLVQFFLTFLRMIIC